MQNRLALSVALSLAVMAGSAYAAPLKSTVGLKTDGTLENDSTIEATSSLEGNTVTVTIEADGTTGGAYGVFSNMYSTTDNLDSYASNLNVVVSGSSFNTTTSKNAGGALTLWNSALWNEGKGLQHQVTGSEFTGNSAQNLGGALSLMSYGAIANPGTTTVSNSTFTGNKVTNDGASGGAIYAEGTNLVVTGSDFTGNTATRRGGAIYTDAAASTTIQNATFTDNSSKNAGGAVALSDLHANSALTATIENSTFTGNNTVRKGGALVIFDEEDHQFLDVKVNNVKFTDNHANGSDTENGTGGAIHSESDLAVSQNSSFDGNTAKTDGGAIYTEKSDFSVVDATFTGNKAGHRGGAIYADAATSTMIQNSTFAENSSEDTGGAVALTDFHANSALTATIENSTFTGNNTVRKGGALVILDDEGHQYLNVTLKNVSFKDNQATGADGSEPKDGTGGAIHSESDLTISGNSSFEGNTAKTNGGAIYMFKTDAAKDNAAKLTLTTEENETIHFANNKAGDKANDIFLANGTEASFEGKGRIELLSGLAGSGAVTSSATDVYVEDVTGFTGSLTITDGVFSVNGAEFLDSEGQVFGTGADIIFENSGVLNLANVTHAGTIKVTDGDIKNATDGSITFDNKFLTGDLVNGVITITTNTDLIANSDFGSDADEIQQNIAGLYGRGASARESRILTDISNQFSDGQALSRAGVEAFRQATGGSVTAGAFNVAYDAQTQFTDSIVRHQNGVHSGYGAWADVYYTSNEAKTLYGSSGYETDIYGGVFGFDATFSCGATAGIAVTVGTGDTDTVGELRSNLDTDFYGVALYTSKDFGGLDAKLDVGYMKFDNSFSGLGDAGDVDAWTVGLRGDFQAYQGEVMNITPHVGVRYSHFESDAVAFNDKTTLNVFETPVGVAFNGNFETAGWKIVPILDFSIVPQLGDKDVDTFAGNVDVIDNLYNTTLGVAATYQNLTFGLDYRYGFGNEERSNNAVNLKVRYSF